MLVVIVVASCCYFAVAVDVVVASCCYFAVAVDVLLLAVIVVASCCYFAVAVDVVVAAVVVVVCWHCQCTSRAHKHITESSEVAGAMCND
jgi:hypothetical protein